MSDILTQIEREVEEVCEQEQSYNEQHYDSRAEEAIDWYQHYMSIQEDDLIAEYTTTKNPPTSMEMAAKERIPQVA